AFTWFAWSGMETVPLAWILMRTARASAAFCERPSRGPAPAAPRAAEILALGLLAPLVRPEGASASIIAAIALAMGPRGAPSRGVERWLAPVPLAGPLIVPLLNLAFTGHAASSTTMVKWLLVNPTYDSAELRAAVVANIQL